jgi:hypothetical protein
MKTSMTGAVERQKRPLSSSGDIEDGNEKRYKAVEENQFIFLSVSKPF